MTRIPARSPTAAGALLAGGAIGAVGFSVAVSELLTGAPFLASQAARYALGAAVLLAVALARRQRLPRPDLADLGRVAALAATGMIGFNLCLVAALRRAEPGAVGVIVGCVPLLLALGGPLLERRVPARRVVAGAVLAVLGAAVVEGGGSASPAGVGLAAGALLGEAAFSLLAVPLLVRWGPLVLSLYACLAGTVMLAVASPLVEWPALRPPTAAEAAAVVFLGVVVTAGGFFCWYAGMARLGVERAGLLAGLLPVAALAGGAVLGSGPVGPAQVAGTVLVAVGISAGMVSGRRPRPAPLRTPLAEPAVQHERLAGDPGRARAEQEGGRLGHVARLAQAPERVGGGGLGLAPFVQGPGEAGAHHGRCDRVDPHARGKLLGELPGQGDEGRLGGVVGADAVARPEPAEGGDVEHRPTVGRHPAAPGELGPGQGAGHVDLEDLADGTQVGVDQGPVLWVHPRVVDQQVQAPEALDGAGDRVLTVGGVVGRAGHAHETAGPEPRPTVRSGG